MNREKFKEVGIFIICFLICQAPGLVGSLFTRQSVSTWYADLVKPGFTPPGWVFGPVWFTLYTLMGVSLYLMWRHREKAVEWRGSLVWFGVQLLLNALWSFSFFGLRSPFIGLVNIILLAWAIILCMIHCFRLSRTAALLLLPYLLWVSFASVLNFSIWRLNG